MARPREAKVGDNNGPAMSETDKRKKLKGYVDEIEHVDQQIRDLSSDRASIYKRLKAEGLDNRAVKEVIRYRKMTPDHRNVFFDTVDDYMAALGMLADTPLGQAAMHRDGVPA